MRKLLAIGVGTTLTLTLAGVAIAHLKATGTTAASATFSATAAQHFKTRSCSGPDGQYQLIDAVYQGTSANAEQSLSGDVRVRIRSTYNTTEKIGWARGWLKIGDSHWIRFDAVNTNGKLVGLLHGGVGDRSTDLLGTFAADFATNGLSNFQLGGGGSMPNVALLGGKVCTGPAVGKSVKLTVKGTIDSIVLGTSITVIPEDGFGLQTCALGPDSPNVSGFTKGQKVEMTCVTVDGKLTVVRLKKRG
jgi:hypothetical protein